MDATTYTPAATTEALVGIASDAHMLVQVLQRAISDGSADEAAPTLRAALAMAVLIGGRADAALGQAGSAAVLGDATAWLALA